MKKLLLFVVVLCLGLGLSAQKSPSRLKEGLPTASSKLFKNYEDGMVKNHSVVNDFTRPSYKSTNDVTILNLGSAANAFGLYNGGRTAVWADPNLNSVSFAHRMTASPGSGYLAYDISKDGGNTFSLNNQVFNPTAGGTANARYPQGLIYNPSGNTNPDNAYFTFFAPTLDGSNGTAGSWGGYAGGTVKLDGTGLSQTGWSTTLPYRHNVPDAMTINTTTGDVYVVETSLVGGLGNQYVDSLLMTRGVFNSTTGAFDYEESLLYAPTAVPYGGTGSAVSDVKLALGPDGLTGYILTLGDNGGDLFATGLAYYPILYKTTDGGLTWDDSPMVIALGGPDGLPGVVNDLLTDDQIAELFEPPLPARDEIAYTTAFTSDLAVDMYGNPVISVVVGVAAATAYSIVDAAGFYASYNIFSQDGGETWIAQKLMSLKTFRGTWGTGDNEVSEDNRSQITTTYDGSKMFFSWLDTDFEGQIANQQPDIYCVGWDIASNTYTDADLVTDGIQATNVTFLSDGWLQAYMGTASNYSFVSGTGGESIYTIPFVYQAMDPVHPESVVQYKYIKDFSFTEADFVIENTGKVDVVNGIQISQNYPNPFNGVAKIDVSLPLQAKVSLEVYNLVGQRVYELPARNLQPGNHQLVVNGAGLKSGVYMYSVMVNGERFSKKMVIN
jgi:hypothetical protein